MKSKVWNKLFHKNKTAKSSSLNNSRNQNEINFNHSDDNAAENNDESTTSKSNDDTLQFNENFKICNTLNAKQKSSSKNGENINENSVNYLTLPSSSKNSKSKLSKMVNSLTLKRSNGLPAKKENSDDYKNDVAISLIRNESERNNNYGYNTINNDINNMNNKIEEINSNNETNEIIINNVTNINNNNNYKIITSLEYDNKPVLGIKSDNSTADIMAEESHHPVSLKLHPCPICSRTFVPKTLEKHIRVCEKMQAKKRRIFDSSRQRREGTELASYVVPPIKPLLTVVETKPSIRQSTSIAPKEDPVMQRQPSVNRQQRKSVSPVKAIDHQQIKERVAAKRAAAPQADRCPYCDRTFGMKAYDRHVEWCKEKAKINAMKKPHGASAEKNRLEARTKYKAPNLKLKRHEIREKYCFDDGRTDENLSMSASLSSSFVSDGRKDSRSVHEVEAVCENKAIKEKCLLKKSATFNNDIKNTHNAKEIISGESTVDDDSGKIIKEIIISLPLPKFSSHSQQLIKSNSFHCNEYEDYNYINGDVLLDSCASFQRSFKKKKSLETKLPPIATKSVSLLDIQVLLESSDFICEKNAKTQLDTKKYNGMCLGKLPHIKNFQLDQNLNTNPFLVTEKDCFHQSTKEDILQNYFKSGYSDNYDPFLSAKRQLEELCSPNTNKSFNYPNKYMSPITTPTTPKFPFNSSLTTSAYSSGKNSMNPRQSLNTVKSNFRRTSSLRSPKKPAPCARPLFVPPSSRLSRPTTIQRGISDEGPISTNFIKPEEYDEMPVKSACVNNYAISLNSPKFIKRDPSPKVHSSRQTSPKPLAHQLSPKISTPEPSYVIKREPSSNLNRRNLRLLLNDESSGTAIPINKTDSLAIFLKYENDLEKLPNHEIPSIKPDSQNYTLNVQDKSDENPNINTNGRPGTATKSSSSSTVISEKELKDKTNILSKQNSLKNSSNDLAEKTFNFNDKDKLPLLKNHSGNLESNKINIESLTVSKIHPIKLEPLPKSITVKNNQYNTSNHSQQIASQKIPQKPQHSMFSTTLVPLFPMLTKETSVDDTISLNSILNNKISKDSDNFIDPKLINVCDNLPINTIKSSDSDLLSSSSQDSAQTTKESPIKFDSTSVNKKVHNIDILNNNSEQPIRPIEYNSNRNSAEKKSLMKRQLRLGRNQFLFDATPSDEDESSPPMINKSFETIIVPSIDLSDDKQFDSLLSPSNNPIFNNFDFEEFLSSFENNNNNDDDDEKFPGFKDCKEFLLNRTRKIRTKLETKNSPINFNRSHKYDLNQSVMLGETINSSDQHERNREIFISIETNDHNDNATLINPCPNNPDLIKNPKVEEINLNNDNKFTKIETYHLPVYDEEEKDEMNLLNDFVDDVMLMNRNNIRNIRERSHRSENQHEDDYINDKACESTTSMYPNDSDEISSVECFPVSGRNVKSKTNADSAYGSLSRHSPTSTENSSLNRNSSTRTSNPSNEQYSSAQQQQHHQLNRKLSASSCSSENLLPHLSAQNSEENQSLSGRGGSKMSKFCHECGNKFLIDTAKFCMECGIKRIFI